MKTHEIKRCGTRGLRVAGSALAIGWFAVLAGASLGAEEELKVVHILLPSKEVALKVRQEIMEAGGTREAFKRACYKYSKDATTKPLGGMMPTWVRPNGGYDPTFTAAAMQLQAGQISEPVKSPNYGWHLIQVLERREREGSSAAPPQPEVGPEEDPIAKAERIRKELAEKKQAETAAQNTQNAVDTGATAQPTPLKPGPNQVGPPSTTAKPEASAVPGPSVKPPPQRRIASGRKAYLTIESASAGTAIRAAQRNFAPNEAVELNVTLRNEGETVRVPNPALLPLGFKVTHQSTGKEVTGDFAGLSEPAEYFVSLRTWGIVGEVINLHDYFKTMTETGRYELQWDGRTFFANLEKRFPNVPREFPEYAKLKEELEKYNSLILDKVYRDVSPVTLAKRGRPFQFSIFESQVAGEKKYYARMKLINEKDPVVFELSGKGRGNKQAVDHFIKLANDGFYDSLAFYDVRAGDYVLGGCPSETGLGAPAMVLPKGIKNDDKATHARGTVSFVTRTSPRQGVVSGGEIGSIFFVSLKDHPEWDEDHVPIGKVVSGLEVLDRMKANAKIDSVAVLTEEEYTGKAASGAEVAATTSGAADSKIITSGNAEAVIKTAKGDMTVTLYEDVAYNTVASFITRAEEGYFSKGPEGKKQTFYDAVEQDGKTLAVITGSPTNDDKGSPGYTLFDEVNSNKCERGALVMLLQLDVNGQYVPNSAGSQFFICVQPIPAFDYEKFTVFGKVTRGLEVLDKLEKGDEILGVEITKKRKRPYESFRKQDRKQG
jgi:cyclophilin family peptidyl-prolyl cis-trans isomerase